MKRDILGWQLAAGLVLVSLLVVGWRVRSRRGQARRTSIERSAVASAPRAAEADPESLEPAEAMPRLHALALDDAPLTEFMSPVPPEAAPLIEAASRTLQDLEARPELIPRRPSLLPRLLTAVNDGETSMRQMAVIIGQDAALTGNLLRIANSSFYRVSSKRIDSIDRAVTLVGTEGIRSIITTALVQPVMSVGSGAFGRFPETIWEHTLYAATAAETHARNVESADAFAAQLLALVHGPATNVVFRVVRDLSAVHPAGSGLIAAYAGMLDRWVPLTALKIAQSWELPESVQQGFEARALGEDLQLTRSLQFGRVAGAVLILVRAGRVRESVARATLLAGDERQEKIGRVWDRLASAYLTGKA